MIEKEVQELLSFIDGNPTAYHTTASVRNILLKEGFSELLESRRWQLEPGGSYFVCRNGSSILAFRMGEQLENYSFNVAAAHTDSPCFRIKENAEIHMGRKYTKLNTEGYGGMIMPSWFDRPLTVAGRLLVRTGSGIESRLVCPDRALACIPNLCIHFNRDLNNGMKYNPQVDLQPIFGGKGGSLKDVLAEEAGVKAEDILDADLVLATREKAVRMGLNGEYFMSGRIDDLECAYTTLWGFLQGRGEEEGRGDIWVMFDNEEVGSSSRMGAASSYLRDVLDRILEAVPHSAQASHRAMANSFMLSADNAHATHPNFPQKSDPCAPVRLGGGVVLKYNASQKYTTNAVSGAIFRAICRKADVPVQVFTNRADEAGGSTLGNLQSHTLPIPMADIGCAQFAMHSAVETASVTDAEAMTKAVAAFYRVHLRALGDGTYTLE